MVMDRILIAGIMGAILLSVFAAAFADVPKIPKKNIPIVGRNAWMNVVEANTDFNAVGAIKEPKYKPVNGENAMTTIVEGEKNAVKTIGDTENNIMEQAKSAEQNVVKTAKEITETAKTEGHNEENVVYWSSDTVAIPVPAIVEEMVENKIEVNGVEAEVKCENGACVVEMPKIATEREKMHAVVATLQQTIPMRAKIWQMSVLERNGFTVAKAVATEENRTNVLYATADHGAFAVIAEIPKEILPDARKVEGNVVVLETDPVLKIYLRSEENGIAVAGYSIEGDINIVSKDRIEFAICSVRIADASVRKEGDRYTLSFKIYDGASPVYVPNVRVLAPGRSVVPQYDEATRTYSAIMGDVSDTRIVATVDGCGEITYYVQPPRESTSDTTILAALLVVLLVAVGWYMWKG